MRIQKGIIPHLLEQFHLTVAAVLVLVRREPRPRYAARVDRLADRRLAAAVVAAVVERRRRRRRGRDDSVTLTDGSVL